MAAASREFLGPHRKEGGVRRVLSHQGRYWVKLRGGVISAGLSGKLGAGAGLLRRESRIWEDAGKARTREVNSKRKP